MESILKFKLPEENNEHRMYLNAGKYHSVLWDIKTHLRNKLKYEDLNEVESASYTAIQHKLYELLNEEGISEEF